MKTVIKKLIRQKTRYEKKYFALGKADGSTDAKTLNYEDFLEIMNADFEMWYSIYSDNMFENGVIDEYKENDPVFDLHQYFDGWVEGVRKFFRNIKGYLK